MFENLNIIHIIEWHLVKKKISNRIDVERPEEDILLRYRANAHEPLPNYAEDHILNNVCNFSYNFDIKPKALAK